MLVLCGRGRGGELRNLSRASSVTFKPGGGLVCWFWQLHTRRDEGRIEYRGRNNSDCFFFATDYFFLDIRDLALVCFGRQRSLRSIFQCLLLFPSFFPFLFKILASLKRKRFLYPLFLKRSFFSFRTI